MRVFLHVKYMMFVVPSSPGDGFLCMHAFVHASYVSERVLVQTDVCMFSE